MTWDEACRVLGVDSSASPEEIHDQWIYKCQLLHPDANQNKAENVRRKAEDELKQVNQAHDFLKNPANNPHRNLPKLHVSPTHIRFRDVKLGQVKSTTLRVSSIGGPYTKVWIDDSPAPWLRVTDVKSITNEQLPLEITIEATGLGEPSKKDLCSLLIKLENEKTSSKDQVAVKVELWLQDELPRVSTDVEASINPRSTPSRVFSAQVFGATLLKFVIYPFIPPIIFLPIGLFVALDGGPMFYFWMGVYLLVAMSVSIAVGAQGGKKTKSPMMHTSHAPPYAARRPVTKSVIANTASFVYHRPTCEWAIKMRTANRVRLDRGEAQVRGYSPCKLCRP